VLASEVTDSSTGGDWRFPGPEQVYRSTESLDSNWKSRSKAGLGRTEGPGVAEGLEPWNVGSLRKRRN
jgi:hypothetical protein